MSFFSEEVISFVESNYPVSNSPTSRIFYGASNGAGFGVSMSAQHPLLIKKYICLSMAGGNYSTLDWDPNDYPHFVISYGEKEPFPLTMQIDEFHNFLESSNFNHTFYKYEGGHTRSDWKKQFLNQISVVLTK